MSVTRQLINLFFVSALDYLHKLAKDLGTQSRKDRPESGEANSTSQKTNAAKGRGTKRKTPESDSDLDDDEDFSPGKDEAAESEEEEDSEPDFSLNVEKARPPRGSGKSRPPRGNYVSL